MPRKTDKTTIPTPLEADMPFAPKGPVNPPKTGRLRRLGWRKLLLAFVGALVLLLLVLDGLYWYMQRHNGSQKDDAPTQSTGVNATANKSLETDLKNLDALLSAGDNTQSATDKALDDQSSQVATSSDTRLSVVQSTGGDEAARRVAALNDAIMLINDTQKLSETDQNQLVDEAGTEATNLVLLRANLAAASSAADAEQYITSLAAEYRTYALVLPKIHLIATADQQLVTEGKFDTLRAKLDARLETAKTEGKDTAKLQNSLDELVSHIGAAQATTKDVETAVLPLQPTDYDTDHALLTSYSDKLKAAHSHSRAAYDAAKDIIAGLKSL